MSDSSNKSSSNADSIHAANGVGEQAVQVRSMGRGVRVSIGSRGMEAEQPEQPQQPQQPEEIQPSFHGNRASIRMNVSSGEMQKAEVARW